MLLLVSRCRCLLLGRLLSPTWHEATPLQGCWASQQQAPRAPRRPAPLPPPAPRARPPLLLRLRFPAHA